MKLENYTVEDHNIMNGLGSAVCEVAAELGKGIVKRIGIQDQFGQSAPYERLLDNQWNHSRKYCRNSRKDAVIHYIGE